MLEIVITLVFVLGIFLVEIFWVKAMLFLVMVILVAPGIYSMIFAAPWLRTSDKRVEAMAELAAFGPKDRIVDLGCGDGKVIRALAMKGAVKPMGYEFSLPTYLLAKVKSMFWGKGEVVRFGNFWKKDFSEVDILICFFMMNTMQDFEKKIWPNVKRGAKVISNEFKMKNVQPDKHSGQVYLYVKK